MIHPTEIAGRISKYSAALLTITILGLFLRLYLLGPNNFWDDEAFSVIMARVSLSQMLQMIGQDVHPPLYYFILHYWISLFGRSEFAVRLLSALFGVLAIPMIYMVGRQLFNKEAGLVGALILALSSFNIWYSQEARMYSLMVLLALLSMYFFISYLQRSTVAISVSYVVFTTLLLYTHTYGVFVVIAQNVYLLTLLLFSRERAFRLGQWVALQMLLAAFFAPWVRSNWITQISHVEQGSWIATPDISVIIKTFSAYSGTTVLLLLFVALSVLSLFTFEKVHGSMDWKAPVKALRSYAREVSFTKDYKELYFLAVWLLAINVIPFVISLFSSPIYRPSKYTIAASVAFYLVVAKGIANINYRYAKVAVIIIIVALSAVNLQTYYKTHIWPQTREAINFIDENAKEGDLVLVSPAYHGRVFVFYNHVAGLEIRSFPIRSIGQGSTSNIEELQSQINGHNRVWFVVGTLEPQVLSQMIQTRNMMSYERIYFKSYYGYDVYLFEAPA